MIKDLELALRGLWELHVVRAVLVLVIGLVAVRVIAARTRSRLLESEKPHGALVAHKAITYLGTGALLLMSARILGFDVSAVLATAGVITVAIGFAAQTSLANLIAGLFLLIDRPFEIGQAVEIDGRSGVVESITLLSTFVRTFDNLLVRWPNEVVLKAMIVNFAAYPARQVQLKVGVLLHEDIDRTRSLLLAAIARLPVVLVEPAPEVWATRFIEAGGVELLVLAWVARADFTAARSELVVTIQSVLGSSGIEVPSTQKVVWISEHERDSRLAAPPGSG